MSACNTTIKNLSRTLGSSWLWGLLALSLPLGGWLLGYGLSRSIDELTNWSSFNDNSPVSLTNDLSWHQGSIESNSKPTIRKFDFEP